VDSYIEGYGKLEDYVPVSKAFDQLGAGDTERCSANDPNSCHWLATMYRNGRGEKQDYGKAIELYRRVCDQNWLIDCTDTADLYRDGLGTPKDLKQAIALYAKACDPDTHDPAACPKLADIYADRDTPFYDIAKAYHYYERTCNITAPADCISIASRFATGQSVPQDLKEAGSFYSRACSSPWGRANSCSALVDIAARFEEGSNVTQDLKEAATLYTGACLSDGGSVSSCAKAAAFYEQGRGIEKDNSQAIAFYDLACKGGDKTSCEAEKRLGGK
jgi:TPR repeat protein